MITGYLPETVRCSGQPARLRNHEFFFAADNSSDISLRIPAGAMTRVVFVTGKNNGEVRTIYPLTGVPRFCIFTCISGLTCLTSSALYEPDGPGTSVELNVCNVATA